MATVKQSNPNAFKELDLRIKQLEDYEGRVGWGSDSKYPDGTPVAYVAAIQELGHGPIPPRPFMRPAAQEHENDWRKTAEFAANGILDGKFSGQEGMELVAKRAEGDVLQAIVDVTSPALSPITLWARYYRRQGKKVTGATIGQIAAGIADGSLNAAGPPGVSDKPLNDTGLMLATLTSTVVST